MPDAKLRIGYFVCCKATLLITNLEYDQWHQLLGNKDLTEALLSRLRDQCQTIRINGPSLREPQG
jgi:DNA replication protein DnaC